jgi:hypothetical protein
MVSMFDRKAFSREERLKRIAVGSLGDLNPDSTYDDYVDQARALPEARLVETIGLVLLVKSAAEVDDRIQLLTAEYCTRCEPCEFTYAMSRNNWQAIISSPAIRQATSVSVWAVDADEYAG